MEFITYEQDGYVGIVTINRERALNALNSQVLEELDATFDAIDLDATRAVILTGAGEKSFVAGADIQQLYCSKPDKMWSNTKGKTDYRKTV